MTTWTSDELRRVGAADELQVAATRDDGTLRPATTIWVVPDGGDVYVRAANGTGSVWYRGTRARHEGHIRAGGVDRDVTFTDVPGDDPVHERIDAGYRSKYRRYDAGYVTAMLAPAARAATLKLTPR
ncbi:DUF2255 family protein [Dactylosporangium sp. NPDC005555]|uniref:DUF2255 family protein n=1 Tax=Dactylosporangium sp. NPDC005555 TaxID=3154889 RepID=UPI0033A3DC73